ncbi:cell division regulator GpsB [Bombilactobacillus bombi]|uniref:cell division regulator GpsB n=1 Tax=Bombilactobacillus bombi TaxID=1303590 RepID=UPI0015E61C42|nr:cell division regulator GpsB [Bombilactobacillus bombi]MBA1435178.1 cell division regulator GpsB [Bombilactobacillus bombi]
MKEIKLDPKQIVEKRFKTALKGYNGQEVDAFLDEIIQDYETYDKMITDLKAENKRLIEQLDSNSALRSAAVTTPSEKSAVEVTTASVNATNDSSDAPVPGTTYYDILKRLSNLERHVFGQTSANTNNKIMTSVSNDTRRPVVSTNEQLNQDDEKV